MDTDAVVDDDDDDAVDNDDTFLKCIGMGVASESPKGPNLKKIEKF